MFPAPTVLLGRFVLGEKVRPSQWVGLVLALVAVTLISI
jgi:EamA domain-containing membrane protein RarD